MSGQTEYSWDWTHLAKAWLKPPAFISPHSLIMITGLWSQVILVVGNEREGWEMPRRD